MTRFAWLAALVLLLLAPQAWAQNMPIYQSGGVTRGHALAGVQNGVAQDAGGAQSGNLTEVGITNKGLPNCITDVPTSSPGGYHQLCIGANATVGNAVPAPGGGSGAVVGSGVSVIGDCAVWNNTIASLLIDAPCARSVTTFGAIGDNSTDNSAALNSACAWATANNAAIYFPAGTYYTSSPMVCTFTGSGSIGILGLGVDVSNIRSPGDAIHIVEANNRDSFRIRDLSCLASSAGTGTCVKAIQAGTIASPATTAPSDFSNVTCRGADGYEVSFYWLYCFYTDHVSNITFNSPTVYGVGTPGGSGIYLAGNDSSSLGVVYNIINPNMVGVANGVYYGPYIQGVSVTGGNFVSDTNGIYVPVGATGASQLTVTGAQFNYCTYDIYDGTGVPLEQLTGNTFYSGNPNQTGVFLNSSNLLSITGNTFVGLTKSGTVGLYVGNAFGGSISGNTFESLGIGLNVNFGINLQVRGNTFGTMSFANTANMLSTAPGATIYGGPVPSAGTLVSGAVNDGGFVELTVGSTSSFVSGQVVMASGVGGINGLSSGSLPTTITVIDPTHMLLNSISFAGSYTSGGNVMALP